MDVSELEDDEAYEELKKQISDALATINPNASAAAVGSILLCKVAMIAHHTDLKLSTFLKLAKMAYFEESEEGWEEEGETRRPHDATIH